MRKWYIPLTVLGIGGSGAFLFSESGEGVLRWLRSNVRWDSQGLEWNDAADAELRRLQERP